MTTTAESLVARLAREAAAHAYRRVAVAMRLENAPMPVEDDDPFVVEAQVAIRAALTEAARVARGFEDEPHEPPDGFPAVIAAAIEDLRDA